MTRNEQTKLFNNRLDAAVDWNRSLLCVGLDPDLSRFPASLQELGAREAIIRFNEQIIAATSDLVCAYKPNFGFYLAYGLPGLEALLETRKMVPETIPVILDCKIGDIESTSKAYATAFFSEWDFDAITANPYLGRDSLEPLFGFASRGIFILCKTSNPGSGDFQNQTDPGAGGKQPLYLLVAKTVNQWEEQSLASLGLVVGATYPEELASVRAVCPELPILMPGTGSQKGDLKRALAAGLDARGKGLVINASRGILYAGSGADFAKIARQEALGLRDRINAQRSLAELNCGSG